MCDQHLQPQTCLTFQAAVTVQVQHWPGHMLSLLTAALPLTTALTTADQPVQPAQPPAPCQGAAAAAAGFIAAHQGCIAISPGQQPLDTELLLHQLLALAVPC